MKYCIGTIPFYTKKTKCFKLPYKKLRTQEGSYHLYSAAFPGVCSPVVVVASASVHSDGVIAHVEVTEEVSAREVGAAALVDAGRRLGNQVHHAEVPVARPVLDQVHGDVPVDVL